MVVIENTNENTNYLIELVPKTNSKLNIIGTDDVGMMDELGRYKFCLGKKIDIGLYNPKKDLIYTGNVDNLTLKNASGQNIKDRKDQSFKILDAQNNVQLTFDRG